LNEFLRDPTWSKVHAAAALGTLCLLFEFVRIVLEARLRKRDIYRPAALLAEIHGHDGDEEIEAKHGVRSLGNYRPRPCRTLWRPRPALTALNVLCFAVSAFAYLFALRGYTILTNWQDGHEKDFLGDSIGAIICYKKALSVDPTLRDTHLFIGEALYACGRVRAAIPELQTAAKDEQRSPDAAALLGDAYQALNQPEQAIAAYKQAYALAPADAGYQLVLGVCLEKLHRWTEATKAYEKALQLEPSYALAHIRLGILLVNCGRREEGLAHCKRAVILAPRSVLAHNALGTVYTQYRQYAEARGEYVTAVELNPRFLFGQVNLGRVLEKMNLPVQALVHFKECIRIAAAEKQDKQDKEERDLIVQVRSEIRRIEAHNKARAAANVGAAMDHLTPGSSM
jgi:tetratricopeptide (TPR) repeat protein